jgi:signal transduction histidine kinase
MGRALATGTPQLSADYAEDPRAFKHAHAYAEHLSLLALPILAHNEPIAVLALSDQQGRLTPDRVRLITAISTGLGQLVEGARLSTELNSSRVAEARASAIQEERTRISQDLHDGLAQMLAFVILKTQAALDHIDSDDPASAHEELGTIMSAGRDLLGEVRRSIGDLRETPSGMVPVSRVLEEASVAHTRLGGPPVTIRAGKNPRKSDLPARVASELQSAISEALANVRNHAKATRVSLSASRRGRSLTIRVADDGAGFDPTGGDSPPGRGNGMGIMRERMDSIYGRVLVASSAGGGTVVRFRVPVERG